MMWPTLGQRTTGEQNIVLNCRTHGDGNVISMPAGFRRHLVGKTLRNSIHCDIAETRFAGKLVIIQTFSYTNGSNVI